MPLINVDAKALEWVVVNHLAQDKVGMYEIINDIDQHTENQKMLGLPEGKEGRLRAKVFVFRLIYGSVAHGFVQDQDFLDISTKESFWQDKIDKFYNKYKGIELYHIKLVEEYKRKGILEMPTGRTYIIPNEYGNLDAIRPKILNYPVQGLGHDLMTIARVSLYKKMMGLNVKSKLISTIHDSIIVDTVPEEVDLIATLIQTTWNSIPDNYKYLTNTEFTLPTKCEISIGNNLKDLKPYVNHSARS